MVWRVDDRDGRLLAVLPLHEAEPGLFRLVGGVDVSDYLDLLAVAGAEERAWAVLLEARAEAGEVWDLHCVPAASPTITVVPALAPAAGLRAEVVREERCPVLGLPPTWEAYLERLPGKHRHELRRKMRRLEREVPEARVTTAAGDGFAARLDDFLALHRRSAVGKARFMDARMEDFFRRATTDLAAGGAARLWFLETPAGALASFLTLEWNGTVGLYNSGFDPERAALAPGLVLLAHVIRDAIDRGRTRFDFLRGEERYKYEFGPVPEEVFTVTIR